MFLLENSRNDLAGGLASNARRLKGPGDNPGNTLNLVFTPIG